METIGHKLAGVERTLAVVAACSRCIDVQDLLAVDRRLQSALCEVIREAYERRENTTWEETRALLHAFGKHLTFVGIRSKYALTVVHLAELAKTHLEDDDSFSAALREISDGTSPSGTLILAHQARALISVEAGGAIRPVAPARVTAFSRDDRLAALHYGAESWILDLGTWLKVEDAPEMVEADAGERLSCAIEALVARTGPRDRFRILSYGTRVPWEIAERIEVLA